MGSLPHLLRDHLRTGLFALLALAASEGLAAEAQTPRPNILLLLIDDMGWRDLACYGHPFHETPHLDRLAAEGMRFTAAYAAAPVCSATRASLQTGQYPARVGITDFIPGHWRPFEKLIVPPIEPALPDHLQTPGQLLQAAGYVTGYFGKWHLGNEATDGPQHHGYAVTRHTLDAQFAQQRGDLPAGPKQMDLLTDQTIWFLEQNREQPFFVTLSHHAVHIPLEARAETIAKYRAKPQPETGVNHPVYAAMVEDLDHSIQRILDALDRLELADNTVVIFTSENGGLRQIYTGAGEVVSTNAPLRGEKGTLYEGGIRVPLMVRWPGVVAADSQCDVPTTTADLLPTFCQIAGAPLPSQPLDGSSLVPLLNGTQQQLPRDAIFFHYPHYHHDRPAGAIRVGRWKLIEYFDGSPTELYDLEQDPGESANLAADYPEQTAALVSRLSGWRQDVAARMPRPNPQYDPAKADQWWNRRSNRPLDIEAMRRRYQSRSEN